MSSEREEEIGAIKTELFRAGIRSHVRKNPLTEALKLARMDLWIEKESDLVAAKKIYTRMQGQPRNGQGQSAADFPDGSPADSARSANRALPSCPRPNGELEEASLLLEKEIEEILQREDHLAAQCSGLHSEVDALQKSLSETLATAEKKSAEFNTLKNTLEKQLAERTRSEEQLRAQVTDLQARLKSSEETSATRQKKLDATQLQLQAQQEMVVHLRKDIVDLEQERVDHKTNLSKARAQLDLEQSARLTAEEKAAKLAQAKERLEQQLAEQTDLHKQLHASIDSLKSLRDRLQAKRTSVRV